MKDVVIKPGSYLLFFIVIIALSPLPEPISGVLITLIEGTLTKYLLNANTGVGPGLPVLIIAEYIKKLT